MRRSKILDFKNFHCVTEFFIQNKLLIILALLLILGIFSGVFLHGDFSIADEYTKAYFLDFITGRSNTGLLKLIFDSFFEMMLFVAIGFIFGTSMLGSVILPICLLIKGYFYGSFSAYLYSLYSLKGIAFHTVLVLPIAVAFSVLLIFVIKASMRFSIMLTNSILSDNKSFDLPFKFKGYCLSFLGFSIGTFLIAVADGLLSHNLINILSL